MSDDGWLSIAAEGGTDAVVIAILLRALDLPSPGQTYIVSKPEITRRTKGYNEAAAFAPWYVQVDLDTDFDCAPDASAAWLPEPAPLMRLSVVKPELEAWLLADRDRCSTWLGVAVANLPREPEQLDDAKRVLVDLTRRHGSRLRRQQLVPREGSSRQVGPEYEAELIRFAGERWRPFEARKRAPSLDRAMNRLTDLWYAWQDHTK